MSSFPWLRSVVFIPALAMVGGLFGSPPVLRAETIFGNIAGNCCGGYAVAGVNYGSISVSEAFTSTANVQMTDAEVVVFQVGGDPYFNILLFSNSNGVPGSEIATVGTDLMAPASGQIVTAFASTPIPLLSGTEYWLVLAPFDAGTDIGWETSNNQPLPYDFSTASNALTSWSAFLSTNNLQFQIDGSPVVNAPATPEPASIFLAVQVLFLIGLSVRKGVQSVRAE